MLGATEAQGPGGRGRGLGLEPGGGGRGDGVSLKDWPGQREEVEEEVQRSGLVTGVCMVQLRLY